MKTGRIRFVPDWRGRQILQYEVRTYHGGGDLPPEGEAKWLDATGEDAYELRKRLDTLNANGES